jgi:hypothetical protein
MTESKSHQVTIVSSYEVSRMCDRCSAKTKVKVAFRFGYLCFCQHHFNHFEDVIRQHKDFQTATETEVA